MLFTQSFGEEVRIHALQTGTVAVKKAHFQYTGPERLRMPFILFDPRWVAPMPIWTWLVETPFGKYLIDAGETTHFFNKDHFKDQIEAFVNRSILKIRIKEEEELHRQLAVLGLSPNQLDLVVFTHLHLDHVDGVRHLNGVECWVQQEEWRRPFGVPFSALPSSFQPKLMDFPDEDEVFAQSRKIDDWVDLIPTPGHTYGHQSVRIRTRKYTIILAGDTTFTEAQLRQNRVGGIHVDRHLSRETIKKIQLFCGMEGNVIYLPSHDPESAYRLVNKVCTCL